MTSGRRGSSWSAGLKIDEKHFGKAHFELAVTLMNLGVAYKELKDYAVAKDVLECAPKTEVKHFGPNHVLVAHPLGNLGRVYRNLGDSVKAKDVLERAMKSEVKHFW